MKESCIKVKLDYIELISIESLLQEHIETHNTETEINLLMKIAIAEDLIEKKLTRKNRRNTKKFLKGIKKNVNFRNNIIHNN